MREKSPIGTRTLIVTGSTLPSRESQRGASGHGEGARRRRGRVHARRGSADGRGEQLEEGFQVVDRVQVDLHEVAVLTGDPVALGDVRDLLGDSRSAWWSSRCGYYPSWSCGFPPR